MHMTNSAIVRHGADTDDLENHSKIYRFKNEDYRGDFDPVI